MTTENKTDNDLLSGKLVDVAEEEITATEVRFYALDPNLRTSVMVIKNGNSANVGFTITSKFKVEDIEQGIFVFRGTGSSGTADYVKGPNDLGLTGIQVDVAFTSGVVNVIIKQYKDGN